MLDVLPAWMTLPYGAPPPAGTAPFLRRLPPGDLVHLAAVVRGRLEGIVDDPSAASVLGRVERSRWALEVAGIPALMEPMSDIDLLSIDWPEDLIVQSAPWHAYGCGQDVPPERRSRDVWRGLGVIRWHLERVEVAEQGRDTGRDAAWLIGQCLGIRPLLSPIGADEVRRMQKRAGHAWRPARAGGDGAG